MLNLRIPCWVSYYLSIVLCSVELLFSVHSRKKNLVFLLKFFRRHDTILYVKQSYSVCTGCEYPAGYLFKL